MLRLERTDPAAVDWEALDALPDRVLFQTREWLEFLRRTQDATPVVARVLDRTTQVGWFTGAIVWKLGVPILGSPFPGWTTASMGFNLAEGVPRAEAIRALPRFALRSLRCVHVELKDRYADAADFAAAGFAHGPTLTYEIDVERAEDEIFGAMTSACRRAIRKSEKEGVTVEEVAHDDQAFVDDYYDQLEEVFGRQGLRPTYPRDRVRELVRCVGPAGRLLLLRARNGDGFSIATGIFPGWNRACYFWGGASRREHQAVRPNEAIMWHAIRAWKARSGSAVDLAGGGEYKLKYGPREVIVPFGRHAAIPGLLKARDLAVKVVSRRLYRGTATVPAGTGDT
jgi:hypothetical protein